MAERVSGDVVVVPFPFTDRESSKRRPADMLAWENSRFSVDASVRIALIDRVVNGLTRRHLTRNAGSRPRVGPPGPQPCATS